MVVAEHARPVKGKFLEIIGYYNPAESKRLEFKMDRIEHWIAKGAKPSDTVASLLKYNGVPNMEQYQGRRDIKRKRKNGGEEVAAAPETVAETPAEATPAA